MDAPDAEALQKLLDDCADNCSRPTIIVVEHSQGKSVHLGVAGSSGFVSNSGDAPYYATVGNADASGSTVFDFDGHHTEIPNRHLIPVDLAREVFREFVLNGNRSREVDWEEI